MNQERDSFQKYKSERKPAIKLFIKEITNSHYIKRPGWEPSVILTQVGEVSKVDIIGTIVAKDEKNFLLDDGSDNILIRFFDVTSSFENFGVGDVIRVIGKPREWASSKYIVPDIVTTIDKKWIEVHQRQIKLYMKSNKKSIPVEVSAEKEFEIGPYQKILNIIAILDKGTGADVQEIISSIKTRNADQLINTLIEEGEIFEISPGKVKLLE